MAKKLAIPEDHREWPDWEYRPFPKWLGRDELGNDLIANTEADLEALTPQVVYPIELGRNAKGVVITAMHPDELQMKKNQVAKPLEEAAADPKLKKSKAA